MIKILFLAANPLNTEPLRLDEELRSIDAALRQAEFRDSIDLCSHWAIRISDLQELFLRHQPDIVHFSGHGSESSEIILQNEAGEGVTVPAFVLSNLFAIFKKQIRCVLLNACFSAEQAAGIGEYIDTVIGMSAAISDQAALQFSTAFYRGIGYGQDVQTAFHLGCNQLDISGSDEAHKPQLLGKFDPAQVKFDQDEPAADKPEMDNSNMKETPWWQQLPETAPKIETGKTKGDVIIATVGAGAKNVAVGKNIHQVITEVLGTPQPDDKTIIEAQLAQVKSTLQSLQGKADAMLLQMADFQLKLLTSELTKTAEGETPSASTITQVGDWLLDNLPSIAETLTSLFATPAVGRVIGKAGEAVVDWIKKRFQS